MSSKSTIWKLSGYMPSIYHHWYGLKSLLNAMTELECNKKKENIYNHIVEEN